MSEDRIVVIGGGITGLAAAHELLRAGRPVVVLEAADRVGGKVAGGPVDGSGLGFDVDMAADGFLAREPEMADLCRELGLGDELVSPVGVGSYLWAGGALRRVPPSVLGAPVDLDAAAASGILSDAGVRELTSAITADHEPLVGDATVGEVLRPRVGDEAFERLVDPLLGGINAGSADTMSIEAGAAALARAARRPGPFLDALRAHVAATRPGPVFYGVRGGSGRIIDSLREELGEAVRTGTPAKALEPRGAGWVVHTATAAVEAAGVILTAPGADAAGLLAPLVPEAAALLAGLSYADAVLVTFVVDRADIDDPLDGAGFLVPRTEGLLMTACSWSSSKWAHYDDGTHAILRVSAGRTDDRRWLTMDEPAVVAHLREELGTTIGLRGDPVARVTPWRASLPQYRPGHLGRCDDIDRLCALHSPGVVVAGATMRGLGLPACVRQGRAAAAAVAGARA